MQADDRDMKIAGEEPEPDETADAVAAEMVTQKANGNWDKAEAFGAQLAVEVLTEGDTEARELLAFTAEWVMEFLLPNAVILQGVRASFDAALAEKDNAFYEGWRSSESYSFYLFRMREEQGDGHIGETFASLCGDKDDEAQIIRGQQMFHDNRIRFSKMAKAYDFT